MGAGHRDEMETTAALELRALEKMVAALCRHTDLLARQAQAAGALGTREAQLQRLAFEERRREVVRIMKEPPAEPSSSRIARLERLVEALEISRAYFIGRTESSA
jgi:hypothetical protein